jgi:glycerol-3-phosphate acyltransferase PlsY
MQQLTSIIFIVIAYLIGSFPSGLVIGRGFFNTDIREHGSGNLGGTNAMRVLGKVGGFAVYFLDILKGGIVVLIAMHYDTGLHPLVVSFFAIVGHLHPIFASLRGGKAVATTAGIIMFYAPITFAILCVIFFGTLKIWKMVSLSSCLTVVVVFFIVWINPYSNLNFYSSITRAIFTLVTLIILLKHIPNFKRIIAGTESKVGK